MERSVKIVVLGLGLGAWGVPAMAVAAPSKTVVAAGDDDAASSGVPNLLVWVEPGVPDGERVGGWVEERGAVVLREHQPALEDEDLVRVAVRGGPYDYRIHIALLRGKRLLKEQLDVIVCECSSDEMLERVGEAIGEGARRLTDAAGEERSTPPPPPPESKPEKAKPATRKEDRQRLRPMGYAGIGVGVLGAGALVGGIMLALRPDEIRQEPGASSTRYTTRPPGVALGIGGSLALSAGITLIVVDVVLHRKPRMAVVPAMGRGQAGLSIVRRF